MNKILFLLFLVLSFTEKSYSETTENTSQQNQSMHLHPIVPIFLGAGLITWGAYELGSNAEDGRKNIAILWGSALVASAGLVLYQSTKDKNATFSLNTTSNKEPALVFKYGF